MYTFRISTIFIAILSNFQLILPKTGTFKVKQLTTTSAFHGPGVKAELDLDQWVCKLFHFPVNFLQYLYDLKAIFPNLQKSIFPAGRVQRDFRYHQQRGTPLPILWIAEYFTFDGEGFRFGRFYRLAGWYSHMCLW